MPVAAPEVGELVRVRGKRWVVTVVHEPSADAERAQTLVDLLSVSDSGYGSELKVVWEVEPGRAVLTAQTLPEVTAAGFDSPRKLAAFLDAIRWSAITSADPPHWAMTYLTQAGLTDSLGRGVWRSSGEDSRLRTGSRRHSCAGALGGIA